MKIEISRSFSRKIQVRQFEPIEIFCAVKGEIDWKEDDKKRWEMLSEQLDKFVQDEVAKSALKYDYDIEESIRLNPTPTVAQWEAMPPEEQNRRQELKRANNRANSAARKVEVKETNFEVRDIE